MIKDSMTDNTVCVGFLFAQKTLCESFLCDFQMEPELLSSLV